MVFKVTEKYLVQFVEPGSEEGQRELILRGSDQFPRIERRLKAHDIPAISIFLQKYPDIITLDLCYNDLQDNGALEIAELLKENPQLQNLNIMNNDIGAEGMKYLEEVGDKCYLKSLRVNGNKCGTEGVKCIARLLDQCMTLEHLDLGEMDQSIESLVYVAVILRLRNRMLKCVNVSRPLLCFSQNHAAEIYGEMLRLNTSLTEIHLEKFNFTDHDVHYLLLGLKHNTSLEFLDLSCNEIADDGAQYLCQLIVSHPAIRSLDLNHNKIGDNGAEWFAHSIAYSKLELLDLSHNRMTDNGLRFLLQCIRRLDFPDMQLWFWGNTMTQTTLTILHRLLDENTLFQQKIDVIIDVVDGILYPAYYPCSRGKCEYYCVSRYGCALPKESSDPMAQYDDYRHPLCPDY